MVIPLWLILFLATMGLGQVGKAYARENSPRAAQICIGISFLCAVMGFMNLFRGHL